MNISQIIIYFCPVKEFQQIITTPLPGSPAPAPYVSVRHVSDEGGHDDEEQDEEHAHEAQVDQPERKLDFWALDCHVQLKQ